MVKIFVIGYNNMDIEIHEGDWVILEYKYCLRRHIYIGKVDHVDDKPEYRMLGVNLESYTYFFIDMVDNKVLRKANERNGYFCAYDTIEVIKDEESALMRVFLEVI